MANYYDCLSHLGNSPHAAALFPSTLHYNALQLEQLGASFVGTSTSNESVAVTCCLLFGFQVQCRCSNTSHAFGALQSLPSALH